MTNSKGEDVRTTDAVDFAFRLDVWPKTVVLAIIMDARVTAAIVQQKWARG
eukprot:CAMPEP_0114287752 /NCGR_PEP_ID=MMETSP0059-20121206/6444_1 /TAXON_ID=36894 /ORGANISM="Pyramimonas parkeae, Strain CCMP726" /LENGTH=50 /DNA_ID=CAMNT_0001408851 /DNA_START=482 /DNA_END=634 /DNA_ORIENTATION=-